MDVQLIKQLRGATGAGMVEVKKALEEAGGDMEKAKDVLRKRGLKLAAKKQDRDAHQGIIDTYIHPPGRIAALVTLLCETDFVARNDEFKALAHEIAKQVAAMSPLYIRPEDVPSGEVEREKGVHRETLKNKGKPEDMIEKIVEGKMQKYYEQVCLLEQAWISDDTKKIKDLITEHIAKLGEKIEVREFHRVSL